MGNLTEVVRLLPAVWSGGVEILPPVFLDSLLRQTVSSSFGSGAGAWIGRFVAVLAIAFLMWPYYHFLRIGRDLFLNSDAENSRIRRPEIQLYHPPGTRLIGLAEFWFSPKAREIVVQPLLDMRVEHFEALAAGRKWLARVVLVRGYISFLQTVCFFFVLNFGKTAASIWKLLL